MEFGVRLDLEPGFPASTVSVVVDGSDVGGPKPNFEPIDGASFTFDAVGGERLAIIAGAALRAHSREAGADRSIAQRRDLLTVTAIAS